MNQREQAPDTTEHHILVTALDLFLTQGIKRISMDAVAHAAGLTRVTVYRYYGNKEELVQAVFRHIAAGVVQAREKAERLPANGLLGGLDDDIETVTDLIGSGLAALPPCDFPMRLDELRRLYPTIYREFHDTRLAALEVIFERLFTATSAHGRLRPDLNQQIVKTYFMEAVTTVVESPQLLALGLSPDEIFQTVKAIFLHGILKG
jgi:TetR/AcrR family transcriptional regulator, cholesterol catabolism regulator